MQRCLTPRSRRGPTSKPQARAVGWRILHRAGLAFCCRSRLSSNVRHHKKRPVASPAESAARSAGNKAATARHSREQPASLVHLRGSGQQNRAKRYAPCMKERVNFPSSQVSASRQASVVLGAGLVSQFLRPAAVRSVAASFCLVRDGRQVGGAPAWSARSGLPSFLFTKVSCPGGTLHVIALRHTVLPNPSLEARPNSKTPGPRSGLAQFPPRGPGVLLLVPPQLER